MDSNIIFRGLGKFITKVNDLTVNTKIKTLIKEKSILHVHNADGCGILWIHDMR